MCRIVLDDYDQTAHDLLSEMPFLKKRRLDGNSDLFLLLLEQDMVIIKYLGTLSFIFSPSKLLMVSE